MEDGSLVSYNHAANSGGGICQATGIFDMKGGTISGNSAKKITIAGAITGAAPVQRLRQRQLCKDVAEDSPNYYKYLNGSYFYNVDGDFDGRDNWAVIKEKAPEGTADFETACENYPAFMRKRKKP